MLRLSVSGLIIDEVAFDETYYSDHAGFSARLVPGETATTNDDAGVWCPSGTSFATLDYGTPGAENGPCLRTVADLGEGDLVITEFMANPDVVADADGEWFEFYNPGDSAVDLNGLILADDDVDSYVVSEFVVVAPTSYVVFGAPNAIQSTGGMAPAHIYDQSAFVLANSSDEIALLGTGVVIDHLAYNLSGGLDILPGESASLNSSFVDAVANDNANNWCAGTSPMTGGDLGSPGASNPACN